MSSPYSLSRQVVRRKAQATQKLIVFCLRQERFAIPIEFAYRLIQSSEIYGQFDTTGIGFTLYRNQELFVFDIERRIFRSPLKTLPDRINPSPDHSFPHATSHETPHETTNAFQPYLLILQNSQNELVGIFIKTQPVLRCIAQSAFVPVPPDYLTEGSIQYISALAIVNPTEPPLLLLNLNQLMQSDGE